MPRFWRKKSKPIAERVEEYHKDFADRIIKQIKEGGRALAETVEARAAISSRQLQIGPHLQGLQHPESRLRRH